VSDQRILRLQIEDVELVDARRHDQQRPLAHARRARLVLDQLDQVVLEHDRSFSVREIPADHETRFVGLRDLAAFQIAQQIADALTQAFTSTLEQRLLRFRIQCEEVARRGRCSPLLNREADALAHLRFGVERFDQFLQVTCVKEIPCGRECVGRRGTPRI
jgi:hypothetical protein